MAKRFLLLGGSGQAGRQIAQLLLRHTANTTVILGGRNQSSLMSVKESLDEEFSSERSMVRILDAKSRVTLQKAFSAAEMVVVAAPTIRYVENVLDSAIQCGIDYLDIQLSHPAKLRALEARKEEIVERELCFFTDGGFHPGVVSTLARLGLDKVDRPVQANVYAALNIDWNGLGESDDTAKEFLDEFRHYSTNTYAQGVWKKTSFFRYPVFEFGDPIGRKTCAPMFLPEMSVLPDEYSSLEHCGFYIAGMNPVVDNLVLPFIMLALRFTPPGRDEWLSKLLKWGLSKSKPPFQIELVAVAGGTEGVDGRSDVATARVRHTDGYFVTAAPVVACLRQYLDEKIRKPGVWFQANAVEQESFAKDLEMMGLPIEIELTKSGIYSS